MTFLPTTTYESLDETARAASDRQLERHGGHITNMKATLLSHVPSFDAYMQWYTLWDALVPFIGERAVSLFSYAISDENDCLVCSVYFRRVLIDNGEDPENPSVTEAEQLLIDFGRRIARTPSAIEPEFYARLESTFTPQLRVLLVAFAGQMVATNLFVTVGRIALDEELYSYRKPGDDRTGL
ncbi:MAG: carboxymuconolactone decarboxylase family protein [Rhodoglobus sp.]